MSVFWSVLTAILAGSAGGTLMSAIAARRNAGVAAEFAEQAADRQAARASNERAAIAHAAAAEALADDVAIIYRTLDAIASTVAGPDVDYFDPEGVIEGILQALSRTRYAAYALSGVGTRPVRSVGPHTACMTS